VFAHVAGMPIEETAFAVLPLLLGAGGAVLHRLRGPGRP
jgi:hypothetical protein